MRICSRCNNEVGKTDIVCSKCGFSLLRDKYGKRINYPIGTVESINAKKNSKYFKSENYNKNPYLAIIVLLTSIIIPILTTFFLSDTEETIDNNNNITFKNIEEITNYIDDVKLQALDYYKVLELINNEEEINLKKIEEVTSLEINDMTSEKCIKMIDGNDALACVLNTHQSKGTYETANADIANFYDYINSIDDSDMKDALINLNNNTYDLYYLPGNEKNFIDYELNYSKLMVEINRSIEKLNNLGI